METNMTEVADKINRAKGCLLGGAVSDALGGKNEFSDPGKFPFDKPLQGPQTGLEMNPHYGGLSPCGGQVTDDTHMSVTLHLSLNEKKEIDEEDLGKRYAAWEKITFDAGSTTRAACQEVPVHGGTLSGLIAWSKSGFKGAGNGSLMRAMALPVFYRDNPAHYDLIHASIRESAITHADPRCAMAVAAYNVAIHTLLNDGSPEDAHYDAMKALDEARETLYSIYWYAIKEAKIPEKRIKAIQEASGLGAKLAYRDLATDLVQATANDPKLYGEVDENMSITGGSQGFVRVAFRLAFWSLLHANSYEEGVLNVVNRGADSDTNGAITGALLGAYFGLDSIPKEWLKTVLECDCTTAKGYYANSPIWNGIYHPRNFLATGFETPSPL